MKWIWSIWIYSGIFTFPIRIEEAIHIGWLFILFIYFFFNSLSSFRDQNYGNIEITKENENLIFILNIDGITDINQSFVINNDTKLKIEISEKTNNISTLNLEKIIILSDSQEDISDDELFNIEDYISNLILNIIVVS